MFGEQTVRLQADKHASQYLLVLMVRYCQNIVAPCGFRMKSRFFCRNTHTHTHTHTHTLTHTHTHTQSEREREREKQHLKTKQKTKQKHNKNIHTEVRASEK